MDKETAVEIIRIDAMIEQTAMLIGRLGSLPELMGEMVDLKKMKHDYSNRL